MHAATERPRAGQPATMARHDLLTALQAADVPDDIEAGEPLAHFLVVALGCPTPQSLEWLRRGFSVFLAAGGDVGLERCLRLPRTAAQLRIATRNLNLVRLAEIVDAASERDRSIMVKRLLDNFLERGKWAQGWRSLPNPPSGATGTDAFLFYVARANDGRSLSARQIARVLASAVRVPSNPREMSHRLADHETT